MEKERLQYLLHQYSQQLSTARERLELLHFLRSQEAEAEQLASELIALDASGEKLEAAQAEELAELITSIDKVADTATVRPVHRIHFLRRWGWAAAILLVVTTGAVFFMLNNRTSPDPVLAAPVVPGKEGAILTLANGTRLVLDSLENGLIASQNGADVTLANGQLSYDTAGNSTGATVYNILATPKGRKFRAQLPDGTKVWLNAASSIKYPTAFTGDKREVMVTGEAYFEVARNEHMPFLLSVNNKAEIAVLGTHFNVNAYDNEAVIEATLLEGAVAVSASGQPAATLKPGQQAKVTAQGSIKVVNKADIDKVMAWKNGYFNFEGASLGEVMRQLERWYDIEVVYEKGIPDIRFVGELERNMTLQDLLQVLEKTGVHFRLDEGRRLIVMP